MPQNGHSILVARGLVGLARRFGDTKHVDVDLAQLRQRAIDVVALLLKQLDLLAAFFSSYRQRSDNAACARAEHFPNFRKREAEPLSPQNKFDAVSIGLAEKRGLSFAPRKQALALVESQRAYRDTGLLRQLSDGKPGGYRRPLRIVPGTPNTAALVGAAFVRHPRPAANLEFVPTRVNPSPAASGVGSIMVFCPKILLPFLPKFASRRALVKFCG